MVTRVLLIEAGPTPWDLEGRIVGNRPLPLTAEGLDSIRHLLDSLPNPITSIYRPSKNEACDQAARIIAEKYSLRMRDNADLDAVHLGLWEGLSHEDANFRFPSVFPEWLEKPLTVTPPDGEPLLEAITRIHNALQKILRRNRGETVALPLRPMAMQIALGLLKREPAETIASHLHQASPLETIEMEPVDVKAFLA